MLWPAIWAFTEAMVYLGFLLPRLHAVADSTRKRAAIVVFFWGAQHLVIPFIPDGTYLISRLLGALLVTADLTVTFVLLRRRLLASTAVHWLSDTSTAILAAFALTPLTTRGPERAQYSSSARLSWGACMWASPEGSGCTSLWADAYGWAEAEAEAEAAGHGSSAVGAWRWKAAILFHISGALEYMGKWPLRVISASCTPLAARCGR
jgi:hypothetical protein